MPGNQQQVEKDSQTPTLPSTAAIGNMAITAEHEKGNDPSPEQLKLLDASLDLAQTITDQYPQTDEEGRLDYAIAGSLAFMLLAQADSFEVLDMQRLPDVVPTQRIDIPEDASRTLKTFARHLGDFDYVQTKQYGEKKQEAANINYKTHPEEYEHSRKTLLWKGGLPLDRLSDSGRDLLQLPEDNLLFSERVGNFSGETVKLTVGGRDFYIVDPRTMLAFKAVHLAESFDTSGKPEKYITDMTKLQKALGLIYGPEELAEKTHDTLFRTGVGIVNGLEVPYHNPALTEELREFMDAAIEVDEDAHYLEHVQLSPERAIGVLKILHRYKSPEAKTQVITFINQYREQLDPWEVNKHSGRNIDLMAAFAESDPAVFAGFNKKLPSNYVEAMPEVGAVGEWLRTNPYRETGKEALLGMMDHESLEHRPAKSEYLEVLMHLDESKLGSELEVFGRLIERKPLRAWELSSLFGKESMLDERIRQSVIGGFSAADKKFDDDKLAAFAEDLVRAVDPWDETSIEDRVNLVHDVLAQYGVELKGT